MNVKELEINASDVTVHRSLKLTHLDFDDDPDWTSRESKNTQSKRTKRDAEDETSTTFDPNVAAEELGDEVSNDDESSATTPSAASSSTKRPRTNRYHHPVLNKEDFIPIKVRRRAIYD